MDGKQKQIFILSYLAHGLSYLTRLNLSVAIPSLEIDLGLSSFTIGLIAGTFSLSYAIGQFVNGQIADFVGPKKLVIAGLIFSALLSFLFGNTEFLLLMVIFWCLNGYAQSTGWPSVVKIIRNWFGTENLGSIGGLFGSCFLTGSMISWFVLSWILDNFHWRTLFSFPSLFLVVLAILFFFLVKDRPDETSLESEKAVNKPKVGVLHLLSSK
jgi:OPA family glycerol-3-phosphate transporter-like MFS transporter